MGREENKDFLKRFEELYPDSRTTVGDMWALEDKQQKVEEARMVENARADSKAIWLLADYSIPADVLDLAKRLKMEEALIEIWRGAFIEGWRAAHRKY